MIRFENVSKEFDSEGISVAAVKDVSLEINKGEVFGIIGFPERESLRWCAV